MGKSTELLDGKVNDCCYNIETMSFDQMKKLILQSWIEVQLISIYQNKGYKLNHNNAQNKQQQLLSSFLNVASIKEKAFFLNDLTNNIQNFKKNLIPFLIECSSEPHLLTSICF